MRGLTLVLVLGCAVGCAGVKTVDGRYSAASGRFSCEVGSTQLRDFYDAKIDRGMAEFFDDFGMEAVYFTPGTRSGLPTQSGDRAADLATAKDLFALPSVLAPRGPKGAVVLHEELISLGGDKALFTIVDIPGASGAFNVTTGERFTAKVAALIFIRSDYVFVLTHQGNLLDADQAKAGSVLPVTNLKNAATRFYDTCSFPGA